MHAFCDVIVFPHPLTGNEAERETTSETHCLGGSNLRLTELSPLMGDMSLETKLFMTDSQYPNATFYNWTAP